MIIEMTRDIVRSLIEIKEVAEWVAKVDNVPNISANKLPNAIYPAIAIYEIENEPEQYADDEEQTSVLTFQISLFSKNGSHGKVQNEIDKKMKDLGFIRVAKSPLLFDHESNINQRALLYTQEVEHSLYK